MTSSVCAAAASRAVDEPEERMAEVGPAGGGAGGAVLESRVGMGVTGGTTRAHPCPSPPSVPMLLLRKA